MWGKLLMSPQEWKKFLNETFTNTWHRLFLLYCITPFESKSYPEVYRCQSMVVTVLDAILKAVGMYTTVQELRFRVSIRWPVAITWLCRSFTNSQNPSPWWETYSGSRETCTAFILWSQRKLLNHNVIPTSSLTTELVTHIYKHIQNSVTSSYTQAR